MKLFYLSLFLPITVLVTGNAYSKELLKDVSIYPIGFVKHFKVKPETNDGNLNYFALSKTVQKGDWNYENAIGTFKDTYHQRAIIAFSNISHDEYKYGWLTPMLNLHCAYKGYTHKKDKRKFQCLPAFKLRVGGEKGLFTNIIPLPKIGNITNGLVAFEIGYKF